MQTNAQSRALSWRQSLQFKLGLALGLITLALAGLAYWAADELVRSNLVDDRYAYDSESALRLAEKLGADTRDVQRLASTIALLALQSSGPRARRRWRRSQASSSTAERTA